MSLLGRRSFLVGAGLALAGCRKPQALSPTGAADADRERSDTFAKRLLDLQAEFEPEASTPLGLSNANNLVSQWGPDALERELRALRSARDDFARLAADERAPAVRLDLEILGHAAALRARGLELEASLTVRLYDPVGTIHDGLASLLGEQASDADRASASQRFARYVDAANPLTTQAEARMREALARKDSLRPTRTAVDDQRAAAPKLLADVRAMCDRHHLTDASALLDRLDTQAAAFDAFLERSVLPEARTDTRLPPELYALRLEERGIDLDPTALARLARQAFADLQALMAPLAAEIAAQRGYANSDYRTVLTELKKQQIPAAELEDVYRRRIADIDALLRRADLVTLPERPLGFRLASDAERAQLPAPMYLPPPLLGNSGADARYGTFVLPVSTGDDHRYDDFSFEAATWWLTAHEGRPGHDLQYSTMVEHRPSLARAIFAFNSVNAEGWGLYAESLLESLVPPEGRLGILQARLMRAAHAFLDIELNLGLIDAGEVRRVMVEDVGFSEAWAKTSLMRYTTWMPGQAPSYFYGYICLRELRAKVEKKLGATFELKAFHDAILAQGFLPHTLLEQALLGD
ncbi:MAG: DUF885 domain-containing protein [Polyangiaceae bacterium]